MLPTLARPDDPIADDVPGGGVNPRAPPVDPYTGRDAPGVSDRVADVDLPDDDGTTGPMGLLDRRVGEIMLRTTPAGAPVRVTPPAPPLLMDDDDVDASRREDTAESGRDEDTAAPGEDPLAGMAVVGRDDAPNKLRTAPPPPVPVPVLLLLTLEPAPVEGFREPGDDVDGDAPLPPNLLTIIIGRPLAVLLLPLTTV